MHKRITVVQLIPGLIVGDLGGGLELYSIRLAQALDKTLFRVQIANLWRFGRPIERQWEIELSDSGVEVIYGSPFESNMQRAVFQAWHCLRPQLQRLSADILHAHGEYAGVIGMALRLTTNHLHLIRTCHTSLEFPRHPYVRLIVSALYPLLSTVQVGVSQAIVDDLRRHPLARLTSRPIRLISNGIDVQRTLNQRSATNLRQELGLTEDVPLLGLVGRLTEQKGIPDALQAFAYLRDRIPSAVFVIVGTGYGYKPQDLQARAVELGLERSVYWLGARSDVIDIIASLDVLVSASLWEGLPTVILEAMALETPVVATDIPGNRDLILHEQTGLLVPPRNPIALAHAMERLICNRDLARRLAKAAHNHVYQFTIDSAARQYERLYQSLVDNSR